MVAEVTTKATGLRSFSNCHSESLKNVYVCSKVLVCCSIFTSPPPPAAVLPHISRQLYTCRDVIAMKLRYLKKHGTLSTFI